MPSLKEQTFRPQNQQDQFSQDQANFGKLWWDNQSSPAQSMKQIWPLKVFYKRDERLRVLVIRVHTSH